MSVKEWAFMVSMAAAYMFVAFLVWGLGRMLQSLFD
jgi:flagellar biogenesis protein FliO